MSTPSPDVKSSPEPQALPLPALRYYAWRSSNGLTLTTPTTSPPRDPNLSTQRPAEAPSRGKLLTVLGVSFGIAVTIGNTIGAGILRAPGDVAAQLPTPWLYMGVWIVGGLYALLGANSVAELATAIPRSGGMYVFVHRALGPYAGFVVGWNDWIATCGSTAAVALVIGQYIPALIPSLGGHEIAVALAAIIAFTVLQWRGVRSAAHAQEITSALKALVLLALVVACFALSPQAPVAVAVPEAGARTVPAGWALLAAVIVALQAVIYTYDGWTGIVYFGSEVRNPARDIPRSMFGGVVSIIVIYMLLNLAFMHVLPVTVMAGEPFVAGTAATVLFGARGDPVIRALMVIALLSTVNALVMMSPRVLHAMSNDGLFARRGGSVNTGGTPTVSLALSALVGIGFALSGTFDRVIAVCAFFFVASYVLAFISVIVLRRREPNLPRPFRAWGYPWTTLVPLLGSIAFLVAAVIGDTTRSLVALALVALSWPAYRLVRRLVI